MIPLADFLPISNNSPFKDLNSSALEALRLELSPLTLDLGQVLFRQDDPGDSLYLLLSGRLSGSARQSLDGEPSVFELQPGSCFGELSLLTGQPRAATIAALETSRLARLSRQGLEQLSERDPSLIETLVRQTIPLMRQIILSRLFGELFQSMEATFMDELGTQLEWMHLKNGEILFHEGDPGDAMYLIISGRLRFVRTDDQGEERMLGEACAGEYLGEFALFNNQPRTATVYAIRASELFRINRAAFERLAESNPQFLIHITRSIIKHSLQSTEQGKSKGSPIRNIVIVPLSAAVRVSALAHDLVQVLAAKDSLLFLNADRFDDLYGLVHASQSRLDSPLDSYITAWLNEQEQHVARVIYETDASWTPWTERCLGQADCILLVAEAGMADEPGEIENKIRNLGFKADLELVLLHPSNQGQITDTANWLAKRSIRAHHHVRHNHRGDIERLARQLSGEAVGLVLGGGGARGFAHLGVIRALNESNIPIDMVGGTSMGAVMGAPVALGYSYEKTLELVGQFASPIKLFDPTLPVVSFFRSEKVTRMLRELFSDVQIEDLWLPYYSVATNLTNATQQVHRSGPLWAAIRSSLALPGIFSPMLHEGNLLVDGAVLNNLPVDIMVELSRSGPIVAVNLSPEVDLERSYRFGPSVSGWEVLFSKIAPLPRPFRRKTEPPLIFENITRIIALQDVHKSRQFRSMCDLYINPPVERFGFMDFQSYAKIIDVGYRFTVDFLAANSTRLGCVQTTTNQPSSPLVRELERALSDLGMLLADRKS